MHPSDVGADLFAPGRIRQVRRGANLAKSSAAGDGPSYPLPVWLRHGAIVERLVEHVRIDTAVAGDLA